jgi:hypothetical protein
MDGSRLVSWVAALWSAVSLETDPMSHKRFFGGKL